MNRISKLIVASALTLWAGAAMAKDVSQDFKVDGWSCDHCAKRTTSEVQKLKGIKEVKADVKASILSVTYDDEQVKPDEILAAVKRTADSCSIKDNKKS